MNKKSDFDIGFDKGFNAGYDLGYEKGYEENISKQSTNNLSSTNNALPRQLFSNIVLTINKARFIELFKEFVTEISLQPLSCQTIYENIVRALNQNHSYSIISTTGLLMTSSCEVKDLKNVVTALKNSDVLLVPSLLSSEKMFCTNSFLFSNDIFTDIGLVNITSELFYSPLIRELNINSEFLVFDKSAKHIVKYLKENSVKAAVSDNSLCSNRVCLIGEIDFKWNLIESLQATKNIIIDIQEIRTKLISKLLPIGLKSLED